ncbi:serine hydrolase [Luteolibacter flavescens]|uniref:Serine hydrolase n=1 Tax=Luteolibacter flavescens TaxID=1859460 RepID=A0ABT3FTP7_9BACT|nr:serine hydrolase [Luteolibacter flavescens]MCW1886807.1 serine hydrolase [Luteolibacter flavescens]
MFIRSLLSFITVAGVSCAAHPLHEIAEKAAADLPAGCIVTAEQIDGAVRYAVAGKAEPAGDIAPEKRVFEIGSITKVFTGLLLADAVESKKVRLDTTLKELLGDEITFADPDVAAITLVQLSTHTSGLPRLPDNMAASEAISEDPYKNYDREDTLQFLAKAELPHAPPFPAAYSNYAIGLLGELLAGVHGKSYADLLEEKITGPLGLKDTMIVPGEDQQARLAPPHDAGKPGHSWTFQAMAAAGALRSTAADLVTFGNALLDPDKTPIAPAIKTMMKIHAPYEGNGEIGLGIMIGKLDGHTEYSHSGGTGGYRSALQVIPDLKIVRVGLVNTTSLEPALLFGKTRDEKHSEAPEIKLTAEQLDAFTGVYSSGQSSLTVLHRGEHLHVRLTGQPFYPVKCIGEDRFRYDVVVAELRFAREEDAVTSVVLHQNGRQYLAKRTGDAPHMEFPTAQELDAYTGEYSLLGQTLTVTRRDESLMVQLTGQPAMPVFSTKADRFEYDVVKAAIEFERDEKGQVTGLTLHQNGKHSAKKR